MARGDCARSQKPSTVDASRPPPDQGSGPSQGCTIPVRNHLTHRLQYTRKFLDRPLKMITNFPEGASYYTTRSGPWPRY